MLFFFSSYRKNFVETKKRVRNSHDKQAIDVRDIEVRLGTVSEIKTNMSHYHVYFTMTELRSLRDFGYNILFEFYIHWSVSQKLHLINVQYENLSYSYNSYITLRKYTYSNILKIYNPKKENFQIKKIWYFSYFCSKYRLWILVRTASARRF